MAVLTPEQLAWARRKLSREFLEEGLPIDFNKVTANAVLQAIEDWWDTPAVQNSLSGDIDDATTPATLTNAQKRKFAKFWMANRWERD